MGEVNEEKYFESFTKKQLKNIEQESPSIDFTAKIMNQIMADHNTDIFEYKPIISKKSWVVIFASVFGFIVYAFINSAEFNKVSTKYSELFDYSLNGFIELPTISPIMGYICMILCLLILFQGMFLNKIVIRNT